jgi:preprotein translocase subunit SecE
LKEKTSVAKTSPTEFLNQVKAETRKVVWPSSRQTLTTAIMVIIMTGTLGLFFFGIDTLFGWIVRMLLSLAGGQS